MALFTKAQLLKYTGGTLLVGGLVWGTLTWTGTADLQSIKEDLTMLRLNTIQLLVIYQSTKQNC